MDYLLLKWIHILSATFMFGTGVGSAFYKFAADRGGNLANIAHTNRHVVLADWLFTTPAVIVQPISGVLMVRAAGYPMGMPWLSLSMTLYAFTILCWLPVVVMQMRMTKLAFVALESAAELGADYRRLQRWWFWLGVAAFIAMVGIYYLMVFKPSLQ